MTLEELLGRRWAAQNLRPAACSPADIVRRLGAMQAQDANAAQTAVALRSGTTTVEVGQALDQGQLLRTHLLRPTWHMVVAEDLRWMMALTGPRIAGGTDTRFVRLGLPEEMRKLSRRVIAAALKEGPLTREELKQALAAAKVPTEGQSLIHAVMDAELALVICSGPRRGTEFTYDLVDRRAPHTPSMTAKEAAARLAFRYIAGHGAAAERDFSWWSGLALGEARRALEACGPALTTGTWQGNRVWFDPKVDPVVPQDFLWLPAYDEYIIGYTDRSMVLSPENNPQAISSNGIFWPVVLAKGIVAGTWRATLKKKAWSVEVTWFGTPPPGGEDSRQQWETTLTRIRPPSVQ